MHHVLRVSHVPGPMPRLPMPRPPSGQDFRLTPMVSCGFYTSCVRSAMSGIPTDPASQYERLRRCSEDGHATGYSSDRA